MTQPEWENVASLVSLLTGIVAAVLFRAIPEKITAACERSGHAIAHHPVLCGICLFIASVLLCAILTRHRGFPQSLLHDESSYLLAADTFAHGHITNPTPRFWKHFETPQQLMQPSYMSKYPPGQAIALATGQFLTRQPVVGAWLATALATTAIYWMLLGFVSSPLALLGGILALVHPKLLDWSQSFWGGSVAVIGAALVIGAYGRLLKNISRPASIVLAFGLIILANSRPFEGLVLCVPLIGNLIYHHARQLARFIFPLGLPLAVAAVCMGYYNQKITGHVFRLPFLEYSHQYDLYPKFWFLPARTDPVVFQNPAMEFVHRYFEKSGYEGLRTWHGFQENSAYRINLLFSTTLCLAILLLPFIIGFISADSPGARALKITAVIFVAALWTQIFVYPHYIAPLVPAVLLITILGFKKLNAWHWHLAPLGKTLAWGVMLGSLAASALANAQPAFIDRDMLSQQSIIDQFPQLQHGPHLILVSYGPMHSYHSELVHNLSNIDRQPIIWARSLDPDSDRQLVAAYPDRTAWVLYIGGKNTLTIFKP